MNTWLKITLGLLIWGGLLGSGCSGSVTGRPVTAEAAIQAIQQAPDPSAAVAAYGSGIAVAPNDPKLYEAYVTRMVDMGLPEIAYHQAQTLTALQPDSGIGWGVQAYVSARRGQLPEAVSDINLAGQFAPGNKFVAHTAGEILAWYDLKADKSKLPDSAKDGLARIRGLLDKKPEYIEAYDTARKAYQTAQTSSAEPAASAGTYAPQATTAPQAVSPYDQTAGGAYVSPPVVASYPADYYPPYYYDWAPDYAYDWGPGWVAPSPWCWWYPCGFWGGCDFFPFGLTFAFGGFGEFGHEHGFGHDHGFGRNGGFGHNGGFGPSGGFGHDPGLWHGNTQGRGGFFGTQTRPSTSLAQWSHQGIAGRSSTVAAGTSTHWWSGGSQAGTMGSRGAFAGGGTAVAGGGTRASQGIWGGGAATAPRSGGFTRAPGAAGSAMRFPSGTVGRASVAPAARGFGYAPSFGARTYSVPRYAAPTARSFGGYHSFGSFGGGGFRGSPSVRSFGGGGFHGGGFSGGGFRGGGFGGGGFHGGGFGGGHGGGGGHR